MACKSGNINCVWVSTSFYYNYFSYTGILLVMITYIFVCLYFLEFDTSSKKGIKMIKTQILLWKTTWKCQKSISKHKVSFFYELDPLSRDLIWKYIKCIRKIYWYHFVRWTHCHSTEMNKISEFHFQCISSIASFPKKGNTYSRIIL